MLAYEYETVLARADRGEGRGGVVLTFQLAGPQPHRRGVLEGQGAAKGSGGSHERGARRSDSPSPRDPTSEDAQIVLVSFPLFIVLGATVPEDRKVLTGWLLVSAAASLAFIALFVGWRFVA